MEDLERKTDLWIAVFVLGLLVGTLLSMLGIFINGWEPEFRAGYISAKTGCGQQYELVTKPDSTKVWEKKNVKQ